MAQSHTLLTNLARLVPGVIYQYRLYPDGHSSFPYSSPGMNDIYEVTPESVREDAVAVFGRLHPDDYHQVADAIQESARTLNTFYSEFRVILPRQGLRWRWSQAHPIRTEDGGTLWHGIISDITERKLAEEKNRAQMVALESAANGIVITDRDGSIEWINPAWSALTGYSKEEAIGKNPRVLKSGIHPDEFYKKMWETILAGKVWRGELVNKRKDGTLYTEEETITPVLDEHGAVMNFIAMKQDITARKQAEKIMHARLRLHSYALNSEIDSFLQKVLDEAEVLTGSNIGFFHFVEDDQKTLNLQAWSTNTLMNMCNAEGKGLHYPVDSAGIWAETIRDRQPHIYNNYSTAPGRKGMPEGHAQVLRFMTVPLIRNGMVEAVLGVGNKPTDYSQQDLDILTQLVSDTWDTVLRMLTENTLARTNLRLQSLRLIDHALLGASVDGRSADLETLRHLSKLVPCGSISMIALDEISDSARIIARATRKISRVHEPVPLADLRLNEIHYDKLPVVELAPDTLNSFEKYLYDEGARSFVKAPLIVQGRLIGVLVLCAPHSNFFNDEYLEIVKDVSAQLALSLHHENLLSEIRRHAEQLEDRVSERTAEIETTRQRLELAVNAGKIGVWEVNLKDRSVLWNNHMVLMHGRSLDGIARPLDVWLEMIHPHDFQTLKKQFTEAVSNAGFFAEEHRVFRLDGSTRYISSNVVILYDAENKPERMIGVSVDVTERRETEATMLRANLEMERALRIKDEFLANMSHELRTPLNAVMGISESLLERTIGELNDKQQKYIVTINESGAHLLSLINDILDLSKIEAGRMELNVSDISIKTLFESGFRMVKEMAQKKNIALSFDAEERAQYVSGDSRRLLQMLVNLLSNAIKFTPEGGKAGVQATVNSRLNEIKFTVWDTGIGITEENMQRLFQPFVQLDSSLTRTSSGTGLGLMLVMQMARMHGGNVSVKSVPGQGSQFTFSLPWSPLKQNSRAGKTAEKKASDAIQKITRAGNILLVEDTESVVMFLSDYLLSLGYFVFIARDGLSGLKLAKEKHPDLILLDVQMPGMDGFEVVSNLRANKDTVDTPVIALTALAMPGDRERCISAGMNDYISKPIQLKNLTKMMDLYLQPRHRKIIKK